MSLMNNQSDLKDDLFQIVAYMITSARGLYDEPTDYGIIRLLDASGRLLAVMENQELIDPFLADIKNFVDEEREGNMDYDGRRSRLDNAILKIAKEMKNHL